MYFFEKSCKKVLTIKDIFGKIVFADAVITKSGSTENSRFTADGRQKNLDN